jgi:GDP-4-dehydro-6-deoxy-D-mannose reductase
MIVLITGATGFLGSNLARFLVERGDVVHGTRYRNLTSMNPGLLQGTSLIDCDVTDAARLDFVLAAIRPERIYHLAAQSLPTLSWHEPALTVRTNVIGTLNLFQSVIKQKLKTRVLVACSSAEYGLVSEEEVPVGEDHALKPLHPYGVSKVAQDLLAYQYFVNYGIPSVRIRIFNTTGPGKTNDVSSDFAREIARIENGATSTVIKVGNLDTRRDITDVRDNIRGLYLAMEKGKMGEVYNLCRGEAYRIADLLTMMVRQSSRPIEVEVDRKLLRPSDEPIIMGDNTRMRAQTGWEPEVPLQQTLGDILDFWRVKTSRMIKCSQ